MAGKAEYKNQWQKENCDRVNLTLPKGRKAELQAYAAAGESLNGFIGRAINETMERDGAGGPQEAAERTGEAMGEFWRVQHRRRQSGMNYPCIRD